MEDTRSAGCERQGDRTWLKFPCTFYHLWLGGNWRHIAGWHWRHLRDSGFNGYVMMGLVGSEEDRAEAKRLLPWEVVTEADSGYEEVTVNALRVTAMNLPGDVPVLYAHNKGSWHDIPENKLWRLYMTEHIVDRWRDRVRELESHDVSAWHWVEKGYLSPLGDVCSCQHATGNYWWARADYLQTLPEIPPLTVERRTDAELWIGRNDPRTAYYALGLPVVEFGKMEGNPVIGGMAQPGIRWVLNPDFERC